MEIPRIRILHTWADSNTNICGYWLLLIEPRWPIVNYSSATMEDNVHSLLRMKRKSTLDFIVEHFNRNAVNMGDCKETVWALDLEDLTWWQK